MLAKGLREQTYAVDVVADGEVALDQMAINKSDLLLLDVMLPCKDGFAVCRELRASGSTVPVLMLTARAAHVLASRKNVAIATAWGPEALCYGDEELLRQMILNLPLRWLAVTGPRPVRSLRHGPAACLLCMLRPSRACRWRGSGRAPGGA